MASPYEYFNNKLGVKLSFLVSDKNKHDQSLNLIKYTTLRNRLNSKTCTEQQLRDGSWSYESLVLFSSLSIDWKNLITTKFGDPVKEVKKSWFEQHYLADRKAFDFYQAYTFDSGKRLPLDLVETYTLQASTINAILAIKANRSAYAKALGVRRINIWESISRDVNNFRKIDHQLPTHKNSLRRKVKEYSNNGYEGLISKKLQNTNAKKITKKEQVAIIDELIAKHTNLDSEMIATIYNAIADQSGWQKITRQTIANRKKQSNLITYAGRNGVKLLKNKVLMQHKRSAPDFAMAYWTLDGWDAELLYQKTSVDANGKKRTTYHNRLNVVVVLDPFNKYPIGYAIGDNESPALIKKAIQNAINHTKELFGSFFKPYQLQSDNYAIKTLTPLYESVTKVFTPASVGNAKAKVIEPYFGHINKKYFRLYDNWSGFNIDSGSKNQPNDEMLNKLRHSFPDRSGVVRQIERVINIERTSKQEDYINSFNKAPEDAKSEMNYDQFLFLFGSQTAKTIKMRPEGLKIQIQGVARFFDSFDLSFRNHLDKDWIIRYDESDFNQVLAVSECGSFRYLLQEKYQEPMSLYGRSEEDSIEAKKIRNFNKTAIETITSQRQENFEVVDAFFSKNPHLNDTLGKHLLVDSNGQHKEPKQQLKSIKTINEPVVNKEAVNTESQQEYYKNKVNLDKYLN